MPDRPAAAVQCIAEQLISQRLNDVLSLTAGLVVLRHGRSDVMLTTAWALRESSLQWISGGSVSAAAAHEIGG